jgi:hypothetical protein
VEISAPVTKQSTTEISFTVDRVLPCPDLLPLENAKQQLEQRIESSMLAFSHEDDFQVVKSSTNHPLVSAVHLAFSEHRPLLLTPDIIWMTIAQGFAQHINNNAEALRDRFVTHSGKQTLTVTGDRKDWIAAVHQWSLLIRDRVGADLYQLMTCNFSTTTPTIHTASQVVMMDAFKQYFDYRLYAICGIPSITLQGSVEDWQTIRERVEILSSYDLSWWTQRLIPICEALISTAKGHPPLEFWQSIYKPESVYGGDVITGWLADLFPYIQGSLTAIPIGKNPILDIPRSELTVPRGIHADCLPPGISQVTFILSTLASEERLELIAGFLGVSQNSTTGCLKPEIGWGVRESDKFSSLLLFIQQNHKTQPPLDWHSLDRYQRNQIPEMPKESIQLLSYFDGATLFENTKYPWHIRSSRNYNRCHLLELDRSINRFDNLPEDCKYEVLNFSSQPTVFIDLIDDRSIAFEFVSRYSNLKDGTQRCTDEVWILLGQIVNREHSLWEEEVKCLIPEDTIVIAKGIAELFTRIIHSEGCYYFNDPNFVPDESLPQPTA